VADCIILKGGGGADLDVITAVAPDVLAGKVILDKDGNPLTGTMVNNGAVNQSLAINSTYTIPQGHHNGQGKVTQNIATMGAQTINPTASQQIVSTSGKYLTGNVTVNGVSNLTAANIKKGVNVGGTVGSFEGYIAGSLDLYNRGAWGSIASSNLSPTWTVQSDYTAGSLRYDSAQIALVGNSIRYSLAMLITKGFNTINYSYFNVTMLNAQTTITQFLRIECGTGYQASSASSNNKWEITNRLGDTGNTRIGSSSETTISLNLANINSTVYFLLSMYPNTGISSKDFAYIKRIWFS